MKKQLKAIAEQALQGKPAAAYVLPSRHLIRVHIYLFKMVAKMSDNEFNDRAVWERIYRYFCGLERYQIGIAWKVFLHFNTPERVKQWYYEGGTKTPRTGYHELICNSLFCARKWVNGRSYKVKQTEEEAWAKRQSLRDVCYGTVTNKGFIPPPKGEL